MRTRDIIAEESVVVSYDQRTGSALSIKSPAERGGSLLEVSFRGVHDSGIPGWSNVEELNRAEALLSEQGFDRSAFPDFDAVLRHMAMRKATAISNTLDSIAGALRDEIDNGCPNVDWRTFCGRFSSTGDFCVTKPDSNALRFSCAGLSAYLDAARFARSVAELDGMDAAARNLVVADEAALLEWQSERRRELDTKAAQDTLAYVEPARERMWDAAMRLSCATPKADAP